MHTPLPHEIFKAYDIRGIVGRTLTPDIVRRIGHGLGSLAAERGQQAIAVGRDGRLSGAELAAALMEGIRLAGIDTIDVGCVPTPVVYFAAHELGCQSCVAVTGSHNPPDYNGLKMVIGGETLAGEAIQGIRQRVDAGQLSRLHGQASSADVRPAYLARITG
jgi:phosphomannomutase/phosphoglucomutase